MNKTFFHFFFGFVVIVGAAFGVLVAAGTFAPSNVDNVASPN